MFVLTLFSLLFCSHQRSNGDETPRQCCDEDPPGRAGGELVKSDYCLQMILLRPKTLVLNARSRCLLGLLVVLLRYPQRVNAGVGVIALCFAALAWK